jgi:hypothetical protein
MTKASTPLRELQRRRVLTAHRQLCRMFEKAQKRWLRMRAPSLALRQMDSVRHLLTRHESKRT